MEVEWAVLSLDVEEEMRGMYSRCKFDFLIICTLLPYE